MRKVFVVNDFLLKSKVEALGYRCEVISSNIEELDKAIIVKIRDHSDFSYYENLKVNFAHKVKLLFIVFSPQVDCVAERPKGYYVRVAKKPDFTLKENRFLSALMKNDMTKGVCIDLNITRATYSSYCKKLCLKVGVKNATELRRWAFISIK